MTQGRKYSGQPKRSLDERKKNSVCAACGEKGRWANDPEWVATSSTSTSSAFPKGKGKGQKGRDGSSGETKKVMTVHLSSGYDTSVEYIPTVTLLMHTLL